MSDDQNNRPSWGVLPTEVIKTLEGRYWQNLKNLKRLLSEDNVFPLEISLKPPRGNTVLHNINHFQHFVSAWKEFSAVPLMKGCEIQWEARVFRAIAAQEIPTHLTIESIYALAHLLGSDRQQQLQQWQNSIQYLVEGLPQKNRLTNISCTQELFVTLIQHLEVLDQLTTVDLELLVHLLPQLERGMGNNTYLRALPVTFVDTKFIENNWRIIESLVAVLIDKTVLEIGLLRWLDCQQPQKDWLLVKPLCQTTQQSLGGLPLLRLSSETLFTFELPAANILVIENEQSCLALPVIPNTIAISGGGKNVTWLKAPWLITKNVGYWGDIDSEGLAILSDVRSKLSTIIPLMMDTKTVEAFENRMVTEPSSISKAPIALTADELCLFENLRTNFYANTRLEQERLPQDYVLKNILAWVMSA